MHLLFFLLGFGSAWELTLLHVNDIHVSKSFLMRISFVHRSLCGVQLVHYCTLSLFDIWVTRQSAEWELVLLTP